MGRTSFATRLTPAARAIVDRCIEGRQFYSINATLEDIRALGIDASRSALARYMKAERERRMCLPVLETPTVATIVDCRSGRAEVIHSTLTALEIKARIRGEE